VTPEPEPEQESKPELPYDVLNSVLKVAVWCVFRLHAHTGYSAQLAAEGRQSDGRRRQIGGQSVAASRDTVVG
jgi:hypothetical protein